MNKNINKNRKVAVTLTKILQYNKNSKKNDSKTSDNKEQQQQQNNNKARHEGLIGLNNNIIFIIFVTL